MDRKFNWSTLNNDLKIGSFIVLKQNINVSYLSNGIENTASFNTSNRYIKPINETSFYIKAEATGIVSDLKNDKISVYFFSDGPLKSMYNDFFAGRMKQNRFSNQNVQNGFLELIRQQSTSQGFTMKLDKNDLYKIDVRS